MVVDRWFPFSDVGKRLEEMDRMFGRMGQPLELRSVPRGTFPAVSIYEQDDGIVLVAEVPGVKPEQLDLTVVGDSVVLKVRMTKAEQAKPRKVKIAAAG